MRTSCRARAGPEVDRLVEQAGRFSDIEARGHAVQAAMRRAVQDGPLLPLWELPWVSGERDDVDWTPGSHGWFVAADARRRRD